MFSLKFELSSTQIWQKRYCLNQSDLSLSVITAYISDLSLSESCFQSYFQDILQNNSGRGSKKCRIILLCIPVCFVVKDRSHEELLLKDVIFIVH